MSPMDDKQCFEWGVRFPGGLVVQCDTSALARKYARAVNEGRTSLPHGTIASVVRHGVRGWRPADV